MSRLVIFDDWVRGIDLPDRPVFIGRSKKNDIPLRDNLLSRKHCSVEPVGAGYRLLDLKSSNGTYLNGKRVEKVNLAIDDIIEIGNTVMVFSEDGVWSRGEALARLRNPLKAQELIGRLRLHQRSRRKGARIPLVPLGAPASGGARAAARRARRRRPALPVSVSADPWAFPDLEDALERVLLHRAALALIRSRPELARVAEEVLAEVLGPAPPADSEPGAESAVGACGSAAGLRLRIREALRRRMAGAAPHAPGARLEVEGGAGS